MLPIGTILSFKNSGEKCWKLIKVRDRLRFQNINSGFIEDNEEGIHSKEFYENNCNWIVEIPKEDTVKRILDIHANL